MAVIKRKYFNHEHYLVDEDAQCVRLLPAFHQLLLNKGLYGGRGFKKVGGSSVGDVLQTDQFRSPFNAFCNIANIGLPILDEKYVKAGIAIEGKVLDVIRMTTGKTIETFDPVKYNYDYFAGKDEVLGGLPDGFMPSDNMVLEIKTTGEKNWSKWHTDGVPLNYRKQAAQYAYLMGADRFAIVATFLKEEDYAHPVSFPIEERRLKNWTFHVDRAAVEDDIKIIKQLYNLWTTSGISPRFTVRLDADLLAWLRCRNQAEWEALRLKWLAQGKYIE